MDRTDVMETKKTELMEKARKTYDPVRQLQLYMEYHSLEEQLSRAD